LSKDNQKYLSAFIPPVSKKSSSGDVKRSADSGNKIAEIEKALSAIEESMKKSNRDNLDAMYNIDEDNLSTYFKKKLAKYADDITKAEASITAVADATRAGFEAVAEWQSEFEGKDYVTSTNLDTKIAQYINGVDGQAAIVQSVTGKFVTVSKDGYKTTDEISAAITQEINQFKAGITLSVQNNEKSSVIQLALDKTTVLSETIELVGNVVFKSDLSTAGATTINGANIETENLYLQKVYYQDPDTKNYHSIISAERKANNTWTYIGPKDLAGNFGQYLQLYGTQIYFSSPNLTDEAFIVDAENRKIYGSINASWDLGKDANRFKDVYTREVIATFYCFNSIEDGFLYVDGSGDLIYNDKRGVNHIIVSI
jgi:roadblock/LC7 domain-containing protein